MNIFLIIGLGLVLYGLVTIFSRRKIVPLAQVITGKVIDLRETVSERAGWRIFHSLSTTTDRPELWRVTSMRPAGGAQRIESAILLSCYFTLMPTAS
ncbi:MAG: hypothetical protein FD169_2017 [Bacillota bacterium]|nr:MAG: hypothetical protein FD169_2017 [Bacillota bacterium]